MSDLDSLTKLPDDFDGCVRLFPLPGVVMFPHVMQPLHIFEPRYCDLLSDAMASNRLITMATLSSGWQQEYEGSPPIEQYGCIGRVLSHTPTDDDRHNVLLLGIQRVRIVQEIPTNQTYRIAQVSVLDDVYPVEHADKRAQLQRSLLDVFRNYIPDSTIAQAGFSRLLDSEMPLGMVVDVIAYTLGISMVQKLALLAEVNVDRRAQSLIAALKQAATGAPSGLGKENPSHEFPPPFSSN